MDYAGIYRGIVKDNRDPLKQRRLKVLIPQINETEVSNWVDPIEPSSISTDVPVIGQGVWIFYEGANPAYPVWTGAFGKNQGKNKKLFIKPLDDKTSLTGITDVIKVVSKTDGTKDLDLTDSLIAIAQKEKSLQTTLNNLQTTVAGLAQGIGSQGTTGAQGSRGTQGLDGAQGAQGVTGAGTQGASGTQGTQGTVGPQGATGAGTQGATGTQGAIGTQGILGVQGTQGTVGAQGNVGSQGTQGTQGNTGTGIQGTQGSSGTQGSVGSAGSQGVQGTQGSVGSQGSQGVQGVVGAQGTQGTQGNVGTQGTTGSQGNIGSQGTQGVQGTLGSTGAQGTQGTQGLQGTQGPLAPAAAMNYSQTQGSKRSNWTSSNNGQAIVSTTITTTGNPVRISANGDHEPVGGAGWARLQIYRGGTALGNDIQVEGSGGSENTAYNIEFIDTPAAGTYTYSLQATIVAGTANFGENTGPVINAIELTGKTGIQGTTGAQGTQGTQGTQGLQGLGTQGIQGIQGTQGLQGSIGDLTSVAIASIMGADIVI
jgi:hypothetical protein